MTNKTPYHRDLIPQSDSKFETSAMFDGCFEFDNIRARRYWFYDFIELVYGSSRWLNFVQIREIGVEEKLEISERSLWLRGNIHMLF